MTSDHFACRRRVNDGHSRRHSAAKTLVYCSEGSPENFNPMLNTTGTTFDANEPIYNRLVEFRPGSTEISPALADRWEIADDGKSFTFHLRQGVKLQSNEYFKPTPRLQHRRRGVLVRAAVEGREPVPQDVRRRATTTSTTWASTSCWRRSTCRRPDTVRFTLTAPQAPFLADLAMDFASIHVEGIRRRSC